MSRSSGKKEETPANLKVRLLTLPVFVGVAGWRSFAWHVFCFIARYGYVCDREMISQSGRDDLIKAGFAQHDNGFAFLTGDGIRIAEQLGLLMNGGPDPWRRSFARDAGEVAFKSLSAE